MKRSDKAVFLDRDGVLNDLVYNRDEGQLGSPYSPSQLRVFPYAAEAVKALRSELGYNAVVVSNQPGVAKRQFSLATLERMNRKVREAISDGGARLDGEYYCMHHPSALVLKYRVVCDCRKPKPGLLLRASREMGLSLKDSFFVGDGLVDVKAGRAAGCKTVLVGHLTTFLSAMMEKEGATPDFMVPSLKEVPALLSSL